MAFANLFTRLSAVGEDVKSPGRPNFIRSNEPGDAERSDVRKRKTLGRQTGTHKKKGCYQGQTVTTEDDPNATRHYMHNTQQNNWCRQGQNYKTQNTCNVSKKHQPKQKGGHAYRGERHHTGSTSRKGGNNRISNYNRNPQVKHKRFMTQEFQEQNGLWVDGRLACRHFLSGKCIKGDDCQLEHVQGCNDLVKEVCKFYVQGFCTKGAACIYMHKSFPCKFFHRKGKCSQGTECRFSHEPLNDITSKLLDEAFKRDSELHELSRSTKQELPGQPENTEQTTESSGTPDIFLQPLKPNFYKDREPEIEALCSPTEEPADGVEEAATPHSPSPDNLTHKQPVCYSVEAVLGPQLSKHLTSFTTPRSKEFSPLSSSDCTPASANQSQVPYSVDAVLRSSKTVEKSYGHTPHAAQTVSYRPKTFFKEVTDPLLGSEVQNKNTLNVVNTRNEGIKSQEKSLPFLRVHSGLSSKTHRSALSQAADHKKHGRNMPESLITSHKVKLDLSVDTKSCENNKSGGAVPFGPTKNKSHVYRPLSDTSTLPKPRPAVLKSDSQAPFCASSGFTELKGGAAVPSESITNKQSTELAKETRNPTETTTDCSSKMAQPGALAPKCKNTMKIPFHSLFARPITDTLPLADASIGSSCFQGSFQSTRPARDHVEAVQELDKPSSRPFVSLFAAPLQSLQSADQASHLSKQRAPSAALSHQVKSEEILNVPRPLYFSPDPKVVEDCSPQPLNERADQRGDSTSPDTSTAHKQPPGIPSQKGSEVAAPEKSVLKTLFVRLNPYQQDEEEHNIVQNQETVH